MPTECTGQGFILKMGGGVVRGDKIPGLLRLIQGKWMKIFILLSQLLYPHINHDSNYFQFRT